MKCKRDFWFYIMVLGQWACVAALLLTCVYVFSQAEVLKADPCGVCQDELGMFCSAVPEYVTGPKDVKPFNPMEGIQLPEELK